MSSNIMTYYEYISDHVISSKLELYALLSNSYTIFSLEDLMERRNNLTLEFKLIQKIRNTIQNLVFPKKEAKDHRWANQQLMVNCWTPSAFLSFHCICNMDAIKRSRLFQCDIALLVSVQWPVTITIRELNFRWNQDIR